MSSSKMLDNGCGDMRDGDEEVWCHVRVACVVLTCQRPTHQQLTLTATSPHPTFATAPNGTFPPHNSPTSSSLKHYRKRTGMSASLGALCPSCGKEFPTDSLVLRHMNNPQTSCQSWLQFSTSTAQEDPDPPATAHPTPNSRTDADAPDRNENTGNENEITSDCDTSVNTHYEDVHPNTPLSFGSGPTFMDQFDTDPLASQRQENIYFPFSSKEEWGLASWLLCSGLSMRAIDDFLALPIVSFQAPIIDLVANRWSRSNDFHSPFPARRHYVRVQNNSPRPPNGKCKTSRLMDTRA